MMVAINQERTFPSIRGLSEREVEELYRVYAKSFGDCEAPKEISAHHGFWELVGQHPATNSYCGRFLNFKICNRTELHAQSNLDGVSHDGQVFVHKVHRSCGNPKCSSVALVDGLEKKPTRLLNASKLPVSILENRNILQFRLLNLIGTQLNLKMKSFV